VPIRISDNYLSRILVSDLNRSLGNMLELQRQAGTMRRINDYADDPRGVAAIQRYEALIASNTQYLRNIDRSRVMTDATDSALQDMSGLLAEVRELALRESSALGTEASHATAVVQVEDLMNRLMDVLNTTVEGNYLFGGHRTSTTPFVRSGDTVIYQGDDGEIRTQTGPSSSTIVNLPGSTFMGTRSAVLSGTADLAPVVTGTTPLSDLNLGRGWEAGSFEIRDGNGGYWTVDVSSAATVDDVLAAIGAATGGAVTAAVRADGLGLELTGTGPLTVSDVDGGTTASGLGIADTSSGDTLTGRDVRPALDAATPLADVPALAGALPLGQIEVEVGGVVTTVDLSAAVTIGDLKTTFEAAVPGHELRIEPAGLAVVSSSPEVFVVRNVAPGNTASLLGLEGAGSPVRMFGVLEDLRDDLEAGDKDAIRGAMTELQALESLVQGHMMRLGGRQNDLDWSYGLLQQRDEQLRGKLSLERDADVAQVSAGLAQAEMSYRSSLLVTSKLFQTNLMMYL